MKTSLSKRNHRYAVIPEWILFHPDLSPTAVRIFGVLDRFVGANDTAWPSHKTIGSTIGVSVDTVKRSLAELTRVGALVSNLQYRQDGSLTSSEYYIWPKSLEVGANPNYGEVNYALRDSSNLTYGGVTDELTRRSIIEGTPSKEQQGTKASPLASADVLGLVELLQSRLDENGLPPFEETVRQFGGFKTLIKDHDLEDVTDLLEWASAHDFWRTVILTPLTFKKNYNTILAQFKRDKVTQIREWVQSSEEDSQW